METIVTKNSVIGSSNNSTSNKDSSSNITNNDTIDNGDCNNTSKISSDNEKKPTHSSSDSASNNNSNNNNNNSTSSGNNKNSNQHQSSTNVKLKRCKHGRIIVKDLSKKKPVQQQQQPPPPPPPPPSPPPPPPPPPLVTPRVVEPKIITAQLEASPKKSLSARLSLTPSTNSESSDIYDPEEPIEPLSPVDSPPLSPFNKAATHHKITYRLDGDKNDDDVPSSAVQLNHQEKYLQKLNRQERVVEEVKVALKPHYQRRAINKEQYKDVLRRAVPKVCHSKNGEINPVKIRALVDAYVKKMKRRQ